ncbi:hypothetical protein CSUI_000600, partial [Cystoisospora suis]
YKEKRDFSSEEKEEKSSYRLFFRLFSFILVSSFLLFFPYFTALLTFFFSAEFTQEKKDGVCMSGPSNFSFSSFTSFSLSSLRVA